MAKGASPVYGFGPFVLDVIDRSLKRDGAAIPLTPKQFDLLVALVQNAGRLVEQDVLLQRVWPDVAVEEGNLTKGVFSLRQILDRDAPARYIETIPKRGYRFTAAVTAVSPGASGPAAPNAAAVEAAENSIAVLPFSDMSAARDHGFFCEGLREEVINARGRVPALRDAPHTSSSRFAGQDVDRSSSRGGST